MEPVELTCSVKSGHLGVSKGNLLLVHPDREFLRYACVVLSESGYDALCVASYRDGVNLLEREAFSLVIVDQGTPHFEGRPVLAKAVEKDRHTPVLVLTNSVDMSCYLEAIQLGATDYLEVPLSPSELTKLVNAHIRTYGRAA